MVCICNVISQSQCDSIRASRQNCIAPHCPDVYNESLSPPSPAQAARSFN